jgi:hypothetical protein
MVNNCWSTIDGQQFGRLLMKSSAGSRPVDYLGPVMAMQYPVLPAECESACYKNYSLIATNEMCIGNI